MGEKDLCDLFKMGRKMIGEGRLRQMACYNAGHENRAMDLEKRKRGQR